MSRRRGRVKQIHWETKSERWMVSYADFLTLVLAVFVVMYAAGELSLRSEKPASRSTGPRPHTITQASEQSIRPPSFFATHDGPIVLPAAQIQLPMKTPERMKARAMVLGGSANGGDFVTDSNGLRQSPSSELTSGGTRTSSLTLSLPECGRKSLRSRTDSTSCEAMPREMAQQGEDTVVTLRQTTPLPATTARTRSTAALDPRGASEGPLFSGHDPQRKFASMPPKPTTLQMLRRAIEVSLPGLFRSGQVRLRESIRGVEIDIHDSLLFKIGQAELGSDAIQVLREISRMLSSMDNEIRVEGFTDDIPINTVAFPSNWELSAARAASVVHLFAQSGIDPGRMAAVGYGEFRPVAANGTLEGRRRNRRVSILILSETRDGTADTGSQLNTSGL